MKCIGCDLEAYRIGRCSLCEALLRLGFTFALYSTLYEQQSGKCAICNKKAPFRGKGRLVVDHCHVTGKARGLLCSRCNVGIGALEDNARHLFSAYLYLIDSTTKDLPVAVKYVKPTRLHREKEEFTWVDSRPVDYKKLFLPIDEYIGHGTRRRRLS